MSVSAQWVSDRCLSIKLCQADAPRLFQLKQVCEQYAEGEGLGAEVILTGETLSLLFDEGIDCGEGMRRRAQSLERLTIQVLDGHQEGEITSDLHRVHFLLIQYGGEFGPDWPEVLSRSGLSASDWKASFQEGAYQVDFLGFMPGFAYISGVPESLSLPRRSTPRASVLPGTLAIAEHNCAIYPCETPGGWNLIGRAIGHAVCEIAFESSKVNPLKCLPQAVINDLQTKALNCADPVWFDSNRLPKPALFQAGDWILFRDDSVC